MYFKELLQADGQTSTLPRIKTRRRPGRNIQVNPNLIPLLRSPTTMDIPVPVGKVGVPPLKGDLAPIQGVILVLMLLMPLLGGIAGALWEMPR